MSDESAAVSERVAPEATTATGKGDVSGARAALDVFLQLVARTANVALGVVVTLVVARHLGPRDFGRWSTVLAVAQLASYVGNLGYEQAAVARGASEPEHQSEWLGALVGVRVALSLPVFAIATACIVLIADDHTMTAAGVIVCTPIVIGSLSALRTVFQLRIRNDVTSSLDLVAGIVWGVTAIVICAAGKGLVPLAVGFVVAMLPTTILQTILALRLARLSFHHVVARARALTRVAVPIGIGAMLIIAYARIDQVLVFEIAGDQAAGNYGAAYRILDRAQLVPDAFLLTLFPLLVRARASDPDRLRRLTQQGFDYLLMLTLPVLAFTIVAAAPLTRLLFGGEFDAAARALPVLMGAFVLIALGYLVGNLVIVIGRPGVLARYAVVALIVNVVGNLIFIPRYGFVAAAWMTLVTEVVVLGLTSRVALREIGLRPSMARALRTAVAAAVMGVLVYLLMHVAHSGVVILAVAACATYPVLLLALRVVDRTELQEAGLWRRRRP